MKGKLLPIGTVVKLEGGEKDVLISGYGAKEKGGNKTYTYTGCVFPEGFMENIYCLFDAPQIETILHMGFEDEQYEQYVKDVAEKMIDRGIPISMYDTSMGGSR